MPSGDWELAVFVSLLEVLEGRKDILFSCLNSWFSGKEWSWDQARVGERLSSV